MNINKTSKIAVVGNLCQVGYLIAKALRKAGYVYTELYITCKDGYVKPAQDPRCYENSDKLPDWVKVYNTRPAIKSFFLGRKIFRNYDLIIALTLSPAYIQFFNKNFIAVTTGSDIREFVFQTGVYNWLLKRAYKRARHIFYMTAGLGESVDKLGFAAKASFLPHLIEITEGEADCGGFIYDHEPRGDLRVFWPSSWVDIKGVDKFTDACAELFDEGHRCHLTIVDHAKDLGISPVALKKIVSFLNKYRRFVNLIPIIKNKREMDCYYLGSDLIVDQFILGDVGMIDLEAMNLGKPVLDYFNANYSRNYNEEPPPIINVFSKDDIKLALRQLLTDGNFRHRLDAIGERARLWVKKFHGFEAGAEKIIRIINGL